MNIDRVRRGRRKKKKQGEENPGWGHESAKGGFEGLNENLARVKEQKMERRGGEVKKATW